MTVLVRIGKKVPTPAHVRGETLVVIDPGNDGALLGWHGGDGSWPRHPHLYLPVSGDLVGAPHLATTVADWALNGICTLLVESQFVGKNVDSALGTSFSAGVLTGLLIGRCLVGRVVLVKPATWQAALPKDDGPRKGAGKRRAMTFAKEHFAGSLETIRTKPRRQGFADAVGMAHWFVGGTKT